MPRITISYRRDDSGVITGRIFDRLATHYGREAVFRDIDDIPPGVDFRKHISGILDESDIVLAIVGPRWVGPRGGQSRLANAADPVRVEIETALLKDRPLIPVLVLRGSMPRVEQLPDSLRDFAYRHAVSIDSGQDFDVHMARLIRAMDRSLEHMADRTEPAERASNPVEEAPQAKASRLAATPPRSSGEIEALRIKNQELEEKLAVLTAKLEVARSPKDRRLENAQDAEATLPVPIATPAVEPDTRWSAAPVPRQGRAGDDFRIIVAQPFNPRRPGSRGYKNWARYRDGLTVREYAQDGGLDHLRWDVEHRFVRLGEPDGVARAPILAAGQQSAASLAEDRENLARRVEELSIEMLPGSEEGILTRSLTVIFWLIALGFIIFVAGNYINVYISH